MWNIDWNCLILCDVLCLEVEEWSGSCCILYGRTDKTVLWIILQVLIRKIREKNVISAYVHMDETTPHMHFLFIPIVDDKSGSKSIPTRNQGLRYVPRDLWIWLKWMCSIGYCRNIWISILRRDWKTWGQIKMKYDSIIGFEKALEHPVRSSNAKVYVEIPNPEKTLPALKKWWRSWHW